MSRARFVVLGVSLVVAVAVVAPAVARAGGAPIVGGTTAPAGRWPDTVAVLGATGACSGTLIAPDVVLTAGHCIGMSPDLVIADSIDYDQAGGEQLAVASARAYPSWETSYDVGVLVLAAPATTRPRPVGTGCTFRDHFAGGTQVTLVGFGLTDPQGQGDNTRLHEASVAVGDPDCSGGNGCKAAVAPGGEFVAGGGGVDTCFGDSGGPVYLTTPDGTAVVGVVSRGVDAATTPCGGGGIYVRTDKVVAWIEQTTGRTIAKDLCDGASDPTDPEDPDDPSDPGTAGDPGGEVIVGSCAGSGGGRAGAGVIVAFAVILALDAPGRRRARRATLLAVIAAVACAGLAACAAQDPPPPPPPPPAAADPTFQELNGVMWFYTTQNDTKYADLAAELDDWKARGIRVIGIYSPYDGAKDQWLGAAPLDFFATPPQNGTVEDFRQLVAAAHTRGMKVIAFMGFHSIDERSSLFTTAEAQYAAGDRTSPEVATFRWAPDATGPTPTPAPYGPSRWKRSATAGAYYWALWGNAGLDISTPGAVGLIRRAIQFWVDLGLDGYMLDSGVVDPAFVPLWVDLPLATTPDFWLTFESTQAWNADAYDQFGLTSWFAFEDNDYANTYSRVVLPEAGEHAIDADELADELAVVDRARARGKLTHAWSMLEREYPDPAMRIQEAAFLAGVGVLYGAAMYDESYAAWPAATRAGWERALAVVADEPALWPGATRVRRPTTSAGTSYAALSTSADGARAALAVYNFTAAATDVTVDLAGVDLAGAAPVELLTGEPAPAIAASYRVHLPAYGSALYALDP